MFFAPTFNSYVSAQTNRSSQQLRLHISADKTLYITCYDVSLRKDLIETVDCDVDPTDIANTTELNTLEHAICDKQPDLDLTASERFFAKSVLNGANQCQSLYIQSLDRCNTPSMAAERAVQISLLKSLRDFQTFAIIRQSEIHKELVATAVTSAMPSPFKGFPQLPDSETGESEILSEFFSKQNDAVLDSWRESAFDRIIDTYNKTRKFELPPMSALGVCR